MINRVKAYLLVHKPALVIGLVVILMVLIGGIGGYGIGKIEGERNLQVLQAMHIDEVDRLQGVNKHTIRYLSSRIKELVDQQALIAHDLFSTTKELSEFKESASKEIGKATRKAKAATAQAVTATKNASVKAAQSRIVVTEVPPDESEPSPDTPHQWKTEYP